MFFNGLLTPDNVVVGGHKMVLDPQDSLKLSSQGFYEPFLTGLVKQHTEPGNVVLDIGANIGYYTLVFASLVGDEGKIYAFEPEPGLFKLLETNIELNKYSNIEAVQKAVAKEDGIAQLFLDEFSSVDHRVFDAQDGRKSITVETIKLDSFLSERVHGIDVIKMDIQGAEIDALLGMDELIRSNRDLSLFVEFWPKGLVGNGRDPRELIEYLLARGFSIVEANEEENNLQLVSFPDDLLERYTAESGRHTNLLCTK
jgi:FkbM family methyltransferase